MRTTVDDEDSEARVYRMWMNSLGLEHVYIRDLFEDCKDGLGKQDVIRVVQLTVL